MIRVQRSSCTASVSEHLARTKDKKKSEKKTKNKITRPQKTVTASRESERVSEAAAEESSRTVRGRVSLQERQHLSVEVNHPRVFPP